MIKPTKSSRALLEQKSLGSLLPLIKALLIENNILDTPYLDASLIVAKALAWPKAKLLAYPEYTPNSSEIDEICKLLSRRLTHEPLAYILGNKEFLDLTFKTDQRALIPRPETESLVELVFLAAQKKSDNLHLLDIGTGTGCIAITLAHKLGKQIASFHAWDKSSDAIMLAKENATNILGNAANIIFEKKDALTENAWSNMHNLDFIIANPPYIAPDEELAKTVYNFEPHLALFAADDGLIFYKSFAINAKIGLRKGGLIFVEMGAKQSLAVANIFTAHGWQGIQIHLDLSGKERFLSAFAP